MPDPKPNEATYTIRIDRDQLDRLREIAGYQERTVAQWFRMIIKREIAAEDLRDLDDPHQGR